ncbi:MAG: hypothetical protein HKN82_00875 [Akkermansiaceae bacterium]|nr:hypothetical protein [Akkermansiaceae bacterium]
MKHSRSSMLAAAALLGLAGAAGAHPEGTAAEAQLKRQNAALRESLVAANQREKESAEALAKIRLSLEALGKNLIDGGDDRLVAAVSDLEILNRRLRELEEAALRLSGSVKSYLKTAVAADPDARAQVEARLRELEAQVGLRQRPQPHIDLGTLQEAKVVSIDSESGLVVINAGNKAGVRIGMVFRVSRSDRGIAEAVVAETRENISGLLVQSQQDESNPVRVGDRAVLNVE